MNLGYIINLKRIKEMIKINCDKCGHELNLEQQIQLLFDKIDQLNKKVDDLGESFWNSEIKAAEYINERFGVSKNGKLHF
ncbi:MAG: hypothetical protein Q8910_00555 [Bacteroidota bacterium]|nr:hypothetical protein [Bacteroidota bacterium]